MQGNTIKLASFIGLSMVAHALLLFINEQSTMPPNHISIGNQKLSVSLSINNYAVTKKTNTMQTDTTADSKLKNNLGEQIKQATVTVAENKHHDTRLNLQQAEPVTSTGTDTIIKRKNNLAENLVSQAIPNEPHIQTVTGSQKKAQQSSQRNYLLGQIHNRLSQYINYPARARRRGWEGSVMIGFNVDKQGFLHNVHLTRTSGYALLDNAALTAVKRVNYIPVNQWGTIFQPIALQLPVVYRLTNG